MRVHYGNWSNQRSPRVCLAFTAGNHKTNGSITFSLYYSLFSCFPLKALKSRCPRFEVHCIALRYTTRRHLATFLPIPYVPIALGPFMYFWNDASGVHERVRKEGPIPPPTPFLSEPSRLEQRAKVRWIHQGSWSSWSNQLSPRIFLACTAGNHTVLHQ